MDKKKLLVAAIVTVTALVLLIIPAILSGTMTIEFFGKALGSADGWLSYWGGYLGAIVGLAAISVTTQFQINSQQKLHKEQLVAQEKSMIKMHESQKEIQKYSIDESTKANDKKERDRIYMNLLMVKNEELIENMIELNYLNSERFNTLNDYAHYESIKRNFKELNSRKFIEEILSDTKELEKLNRDEMKLKEQKLVNKIEEIKRKETEIRMKIQGVSAKIKTKSMYFSGLDRQIDSYRIEISSALEEFYYHIEKQDINLNDFSKKVEKSWTELHRLTNVILNSCQDNLSDIVNRFINSEH